MIVIPVAEDPSIRRPAVATIELANNNPSGLIRCTIGPAKKRSMNIKADV